MLIRRADIWRIGVADIRIRDGRIAEVGALTPQVGERIIDAFGGALLPGLHDHHIHLAATAAQRSSVDCGPPTVSDENALAAALTQPGAGWLRGVNYHEGIAGLLSATQLDHMQAARPVRIQHRTGRMWFLNSAALEDLLARQPAPPGLERSNGCFTGRLFDEDSWLRSALGGAPPDFAGVSADLARMGVTGLTDMSPANDASIADYFVAQRSSGQLTQNVVLAGSLSLGLTAPRPLVRCGPAKLHLHEAQLPDYDEAVAFVRSAHEQNRTVAVHCVTEVELVFALAAFREAGVMRGDRIEHASIAPDHLVDDIADLGLWVATQPHFIADRGDRYLEEVDASDHAHLYRLRSFLDRDITLAAGSDAPYGAPDPWAAMRAATQRQTRSGRSIGAEEALTPEEALSLYLADPLDLTTPRTIKVGAPADVVLLEQPWTAERDRLSADAVQLTVRGGSIIYDGVDQPPIERGLGVHLSSGQDHQCSALSSDPP